MAFDFDKLQIAAQAANDAASRYLTRLRRVIDARTDEGVEFTAAQKAAVKAAAATDAATLATAAAFIKAQHDANP